MSKHAAFRRGRSLGAKISGEGVIPEEHFWVSAKLDTFLLSDSANCIVCSRFDTIPACDRRTDRRTHRRTDGIAIARTALAMRALGRAVIIATHDVRTRCNVQYHIVMTVQNVIIEHQIVD